MKYSAVAKDYEIGTVSWRIRSKRPPSHYEARLAGIFIRNPEIFKRHSETYRDNQNKDPRLDDDGNALVSVFLLAGLTFVSPREFFKTANLVAACLRLAACLALAATNTRDVFRSRSFLNPFTRSLRARARHAGGPFLRLQVSEGKRCIRHPLHKLPP